MNVKIAYSLEKWYNVVTTTNKNHGGICYGNYVMGSDGTLRCISNLQAAPETLEGVQQSFI